MNMSPSSQQTIAIIFVLLLNVITLKGIKLLDDNLQFLLATLLFIFMGCLLAWTSKKVRLEGIKHQNNMLNTLDRKTAKNGFLALDAQIAEKMYEGAQQKEIDQILTSIKLPKKLQNLIKVRARKIANPYFMRNPSKVKRINAISKYGALAIILCSAPMIGYGWAEHQYLLASIGILIIWYADSIVGFTDLDSSRYRYNWFKWEKPRQSGALFAAWKNRNTDENKLKPFLARYLINSAYLSLDCQTILDERNKLFFSQNYARSSNTGRSDGPAFKNNESHYVFKKGKVEVHNYSSDPREPYSGNQYSDFNEFFSKVMAERVVGIHEAEVVFYPEVSQAHRTMMQKVNDSSLKQEVRTDSMLNMSDTTSKYRKESNIFYQKQVQNFMRSLKYKLIARLLAI